MTLRLKPLSSRRFGGQSTLSADSAPKTIPEAGLGFLSQFLDSSLAFGETLSFSQDLAYLLDCILPRHSYTFFSLIFSLFASCSI